ncbi:iron ABC transporter permease [Corynebacterium sp. HMSC073H12]|uniref:FecCD family ABC transporter permease n=1 Tax=Corynebacterium sp. HMSC073H12 TaxID=1715187 RepID=UPI0008AA1595|nr:iron ABC transporter permease [Corynebacterium sp. HMSC073H12]OHQ78401.1 iron ABC transporter [Corynebacterium sp. HMSC073H12]
MKFRAFWACVLICVVTVVAISFYRLSGLSAPANAPQLYPELRSLTRDRLLAAVIVGASLGVGGVLLRTATANPLADPQITGVNSGAAFGAVATAFVTGSATGALLLPGALIGGGAAAAFTISLSMRGSSPESGGANAIQKMVLLGIAVSAIFSALTSIFLVLDEAQLTTVLAWLNGRLAGVRLPDLVPALIALVLIFPAFAAGGRALDALGAGDAVSRSIGANPARVRVGSVVGAVVLTATCVAAAGPIGFLGLLAAVVAQRVAGRTHRRSLVAAAVVGSATLLIADSLGQWLWAPAETPVGILTGIAGAPLLLWGIRSIRSARQGGRRRGY